MLRFRPILRAQLVFQRCPDCSQSRVSARDGFIAVSPAEVARYEGCAEQVVIDGPTPPRLRRQLLGREGGRCGNPRCHNLAELRENTDRLVPLRWDEQVEGEFSVALRIELENRRGMIAVLATRINSMDVNIEKISSEDKDYQFSYVDLEMSVQNRVHLAAIMKRIRTLKEVHRVTRVRH